MPAKLRARRTWRVPRKASSSAGMEICSAVVKRSRAVSHTTTLLPSWLEGANDNLLCQDDHAVQITAALVCLHCSSVCLD